LSGAPRGPSLRVAHGRGPRCAGEPAQAAGARVPESALGLAEVRRVCDDGFGDVCDGFLQRGGAWTAGRLEAPQGWSPEGREQRSLPAPASGSRRRGAALRGKVDRGAFEGLLRGPPHLRRGAVLGRELNCKSTNGPPTWRLRRRRRRFLPTLCGELDALGTAAVASPQCSSSTRCGQRTRGRTGLIRGC
jgi:hypothetical protein